MKIISIFFFILYAIPFSYPKQQDKNEGYVIYHANWIKNKTYSQEFIQNYPEQYKRSLKIDSLLTKAVYSVNFQDYKSFGSTQFVDSNDDELLSYGIAQMDNNMMHSYDHQTGKNTALLNFGGELIAITRNHKNAWNIDYSKSKIIDGYKCYYAEYKGASTKQVNGSEPIYAWFTPDIPMPFGPVGYGGLPGLIIELVENNISITAVQINLDKLKSDVVMIEKAKTMMTATEFLRDKDEMRKAAKRLMIARDKQ